MRTLENWEKAPAERPRLGRPPHPPEVRRHAYYATCREMHRQGPLATWRSVAAVLGKSCPTRLVQEAVGRFKEHRRRRHEQHVAEAREHVEVLVSGSVYGEDSTYLGRDVDGKAVIGETIRDIASALVVYASAGGHLKGRDVIAALDAVRRERGALPLVLITDNGSIYTCRAVEEYLRDNEVVHLRNLPHTPQHNASCERAQRELKSCVLLAHDDPCCSREEWARRLEEARVILNERLPRMSRGYLTAETCDRALPPWYTRASRAELYAAACAAVAEAKALVDGPRARRRAEREAILTTMEIFGLIRRTRGGAPINPQLCERLT